MSSLALQNQFPLAKLNGSKFPVKASVLHRNLEVDMRLREWLPLRIEEYGFVKNTDFEIRHKKVCGQPLKFQRLVSNVYLTLNTAKELAMVEKSEVGRRVRKYFLKCEKQLLSPKPAGKMITDEYGTKYKPKVLPEDKKVKVVATAAEILGIEHRDHFAKDLTWEEITIIQRELQKARGNGLLNTSDKWDVLSKNLSLTPKDVNLDSEYNCFYVLP
jgi:phage anti-repressor protein